MSNDFTIIKITPSPAQSEHNSSSAPLTIETFRASQILRPKEDLHNYIRRNSESRFLTERIFASDFGGSFWQISQSHAPESAKKDKRQRIVVKTGRLYTATIGVNWFVPQAHDGSPRLLAAKDLGTVCTKLLENISQGRAYADKYQDSDIESKVFFPQEFYIPIDGSAFAEAKPIGDIDTLSSRLFEISMLISTASKIRPCAHSLMLFLAAFFESKASSPLNHLSLFSDIEKIKKRYSKEVATRMFLGVMEAMLSVAVAYARVAVEISRIDTSRFDKESAGQLVDSENWIVMANHAIENGDVKARIVANQFLKDVENADYVCSTINRIAEASSIYKNLNNVIADIDDDDDNGNGELLLAPLDDKEALEKLIAKAKRNIQKALDIEKEVSKIEKEVSKVFIGKKAADVVG